MCTVGAGPLATGPSHQVAEGPPTAPTPPGRWHPTPLSPVLQCCYPTALQAGPQVEPGQNCMTPHPAVTLFAVVIQSVPMPPCVQRPHGMATSMTAITHPQVTPLRATPTQSQSIQPQLTGTPLSGMQTHVSICMDSLHWKQTTGSHCTPLVGSPTGIMATAGQQRLLQNHMYPHSQHGTS